MLKGLKQYETFFQSGFNMVRVFFHCTEKVEDVCCNCDTYLSTLCVLLNLRSITVNLVPSNSGTFSCEIVVFVTLPGPYRFTLVINKSN